MAEKRKKSGATYRREKKKKIRDWVVLWMDFYSVSLVKSYVMTMQHGSGRGSNLIFLSNDTQNKIVLIISQLITEKIVKALQECRAWALIVDHNSRHCTPRTT